MKKYKKIIITAIVLIILLILSTKSYGATNPYPKWQTIDGHTTIRCTHYAWEQAYKYTGIALPGWGHAKTWYSYAKKAGYSVGRVPKEKSIIVYTSGKYGHVAWVHSKFAEGSGYDGAYWVWQGGWILSGKPAGGNRNS